MDVVWLVVGFPGGRSSANMTGIETLPPLAIAMFSNPLCSLGTQFLSIIFISSNKYT